jgi:ATP-dependent Clp protease ATP-binding subunit ClpC
MSSGNLSSEISDRVKQVLSQMSWDPKKGTVSSLDVVRLLSKDTDLDKIISSNNLEKIKHKPIKLDDILSNSFLESADLRSGEVTTDHLLLAVLKTLKSKKYNKVKDQVFTLNKNKPSISKDLEYANYLESIGVFQKLTSNDFTLNFKHIVPRPKIEKQVIQTLTRKYKNSVLMVGSKGSGKTSLILSLAHRISKENVPSVLKNCVLISVNINRFVNSGQPKDRFESSFQALIQENVKKGQYTIFFFDDIHLLPNVGLYGFSPPLQNVLHNTSGSNGTSLSNKALDGSKDSSYQSNKLIDNLDSTNSSPKVAFIASINDDYGDKFFDSPLPELWEVLDIPKADRKTLIKILKANKPNLEKHYNLSISPKVCSDIVKYVENNQIDTYTTPEDFVSLLDSMCSNLIYRYDKRSKTVSYNSSIPQHISKKDPLISFDMLEYSKVSKEITNISRLTLSSSFALQYLKKHNNEPKDILKGLDFKNVANLQTKLSKDIIGQEAALASLTRAVKRATLSLNESNKPIASMLFLGPTGVGKTQTAKALATHLFGDNALLRLDMSDFAEKHTIARLVGSPAGYVGYGEGAQLVDFVNQHPKSVVLFDEVEKAHPDVLNILLSILEEGELTSAEGTVAKFNNTIVILTSNLGAELINKQQIGFLNSSFNIQNKQIEERLKENLKKQIKLEILNRLDNVVVFNLLNKTHAKKIARNNLNDFLHRLKKRHSVYLTVTPKVLNSIVLKGYSTEYGARELKRSLNSNLVDKVVDVIISNKRVPKKLNAQVKNGEIFVIPN